MEVLRELLHPVNLIVFLLMISVLVAAHEYGHYLFARLFNMGVEEFAIGFGRPKLLTYLKRTYLIPLKPGQEPQQLPGDEQKAAESLSPGQKLAYALEGGVTSHSRPEVVDTPRGKALKETTDFTVRAWPLGGFVRIKGMMPEEDGSETRVAGGFYSKPPWQRLIVLLAGPVFSILAGIILLIPIFATMGMRRETNAPVIGGVSDPSPAHKAGLQVGDRIVSIEGKPISTFYEMLTIVRDSPGKPLRFEYVRAGKLNAVTITPEVPKEASPLRAPDLSITTDYRMQGKIGVLPDTERVPMTWAQATGQAFQAPIQMIVGLAERVTKPRALKDSVGSIGSILAMTSAATKLGLLGLIQFAALLSISVGILNLLPIPPLDGGQMVIAIAEMLRRGKRLSMRVQQAVNLAGLAAVLTLFIAAFYIDIGRLASRNDNTRKVITKEDLERK